MRNEEARFHYARACGLSPTAARALAGKAAAFRVARKLLELLGDSPLRVVAGDKHDTG